MISFIITVLNRPDNLTKFFAEMPPQTANHEWIVVDNGSDVLTKQVEYWLQGYPYNISLIENSSNLGFGQANNQGAEIAKGECLVFTQPDVRFRGDVAKYLDETLLEGFLYGHQLLNRDTGWNRFGSLVVPYLTGYFLACLRGTWATLGGFDPIYYPADFEDVDLSFTAVHKGITLKALDVPVSHDHFGSTWVQFSNREEVTKRNRSLFAAKWNLDNGRTVRDPERLSANSTSVV